MKALDKIFAEKLLKIKAIKLQPDNPFTWASGWKSPFYCDNRKTLSYPDLRSFVKTELSRVIMENFEDVDAIAGVATGAIPQGALVADVLNKPFVYVRSKPKDHGLEVAAYTYGFDAAKEAFKKANVQLITLTNYEAVLDVALKTGYITENQVSVLNTWRKDPSQWKG